MSNYSDSSFGEENTNSSWYKVLQLVPEKSKVLDIGCSSGNFGAELIKRKGCTVDGIEIFPKDAKLAEKKLRNVYVLDIERDDLSVVKDRYDVLYMGDVIEHLATPAQSLERVRKLLKPNGKLIFSVPNMAHATVRLLLLKGDFDYTETGLLDKTHLHFFTLEELKRVLNESGLTLTKIDFVVKDYPNALIEDYLKPLGLRGGKKFYDLLRQPDAAAFQFVGEAHIAKKGLPKVKREQFGPMDLFESYFNNTVNPLKERISELEAQNGQLQAEKQALHQQAQRLEALKKQPVRTIARGAARHIKRRLKA